MAFKLVFILCLTITLSSAQWSWFRRATTSTLPPTTTTSTTTTTPRSTVAVTRPPVTKPPTQPIAGPARPNPAGGTKPGACSPPIGVGVCIAECDGDSACRGDFKCCPTLCGGRVCSRAVTALIGPTANTAGACPKPDDHPGAWICNSLCDADVACRAGEKCCENTCGAMVCTALDIVFVSAHSTANMACFKFASLLLAIVVITAANAQRTSTKPGICPQTLTANRPSPGQRCPSNCSRDSDCRGTEKCCSNICGGRSCLPISFGAWLKRELHDRK
ncbi:hypothetical protein B566_EDAN000749 [Ephemera danica]|nr:hypothetical protein B566_EDAN000749 [Ephemera danica]